MHIVHITALRLFSDGVLRLFFRPDEKHVPARRGQISHHGFQILKHRYGLLEIDNMNAVARAENVRLHLRIPTARLVPKVDTCLE